MTLLLIRHGETPLNVARVLQPADTPLSARGQAQAAALARSLVNQGLRVVLSSDLPRALQTAQAVAQACGLTVVTSPLLQERNFGDLRGLPYDSLGFDPLTREEAPPGGESTAQFEQRCTQAWAWVMAQQAQWDSPLAVVSHGLVLRQWLQAGPLQVPAHLALPHGLANTSVTAVSARPPHTVHSVDNTDHLQDGVGLDGASLSGG
jgi:broad specificity phosphatase PhoE